MAVVRCVCYRKSFTELKQLATARGWTTSSQIATATNCTLGCGSCLPYITAMLDTGHTSFAVAEPGNAPRPCPPDPWDPA